MSDSTLLRFLNPQTGPVVSIVSVPYPSIWRRKLWHSRAALHPQYVLRRGSKVMDSCGSGWSTDKQESQSKAITEAVERWALAHFSEFPEKAGLDIDNTSTGFAALPASFSKDHLRQNAYCEALERWTLDSLWNDSNIPIERVIPEERTLHSLFDKFHGHLHCFRAIFDATDIDFFSSNPIVFYLCLFETQEGGVLPGSACSIDSKKAEQRALTEAFMHALAFDRLRKQNPATITDILEQRICFFGKDPLGYKTLEAHLKINGTITILQKPNMIFSLELQGPWNPEIAIWRVILENTKPFMDGGVHRFMI